MKVGVLGSSGFLGHHVVKVLSDNNVDFAKGSRRDSECDATSTKSICSWIDRYKLTHIINLAAYCGGIGLNKKSPFDLWLVTTRIMASVLEASVIKKIKLIQIGTVCSYAANCPVPFKESDLMHHGMPEYTNRAYALSKLSGLVGGVAAAVQHNIQIINLIPVNMYGPYDNFNLENSHVIPALIRKVDEAIRFNSSVVEIWGDGSVSREFLYAEDCARAIYKALDKNIDSNEFINIGTGNEITIKNLIWVITKLMGYNGDLKFNNNKPNGQMRRCLDISKAKELLDWQPIVKLFDGLKMTIDWYRDCINKGISWS